LAPAAFGTYNTSNPDLVHHVIEFVFIDHIDYKDLSFTQVGMKQLEYSIAVCFYDTGSYLK